MRSARAAVDIPRRPRQPTIARAILTGRITAFTTAPLLWALPSIRSGARGRSRCRCIWTSRTGTLRFRPEFRSGRVVEREAAPKWGRLAFARGSEWRRDTRAGSYNAVMSASHGAMHGLRRALADGALRPSKLAEEALQRANHNEGHNTYIWMDAAWTRAEALRAEAIPRGTGGRFGDGRADLWGLPVSVKDCFDLKGAPTSCGAHYWRDAHGIATRDSWLVEQLRAAGAVIVGKTHLHALAYGITGENVDYGDCIQPGNPGALTGGSSSGAVASTMEGSAVAAIGTDTGGSVRVPASLGGLAGYRATIGRGDWRGGAHLAASFDTMGWLFRDLEDAPMLAGPFAGGRAANEPAAKFKRFAYVADNFLHDCEPQVKEGF